jgi:hypothetical protein
MKITIFTFFILASFVAKAESFHCASEDGKVTLIIKDLGPAKDGVIPTAVVLQGLGEKTQFEQCEQVFGKIQNTDVIGVTCDAGEESVPLSIGIFLPELDGFVENPDMKSADIQCQIK